MLSALLCWGQAICSSAICSSPELPYTFAHKQVRQIHRQLPPGGVLVFVTGQREVEHLVARLRAALAPPAATAPGATETPPTPADEVHGPAYRAALCDAGRLLTAAMRRTAFAPW